MSLDLNRIDGIIGIFLLGGATACFPAFMVFALSNAYILSGLGLAARIFAIIGAISFILGLVLIIINRKRSEKRPHEVIDTAVTVLVFLATSTVIVMTILAFALGDLSIY